MSPMTPRQADRLLWALLAATLLVACLVAAAGCHAPMSCRYRPTAVRCGR